MRTHQVVSSFRKSRLYVFTAIVIVIATTVILLASSSNISVELRKALGRADPNWDICDKGSASGWNKSIVVLNGRPEWNGDSWSDFNVTLYNPTADYLHKDIDLSWPSRVLNTYAIMFNQQLKLSAEDYFVFIEDDVILTDKQRFIMEIECWLARYSTEADLDFYSLFNADTAHSIYDWGTQAFVISRKGLVQLLNNYYKGKVHLPIDMYFSMTNKRYKTKVKIVNHVGSRYKPIW
ncbi:hypothetical protein K493DRAFT_372207 [Basidiobolus meristosporus CBS 931.73]|uniref:Uncharacterized protein n=1 Tax=Basidiobolus meristosporus CBS 931.73 TaxID=1314790 RepID=A0A1Y1VPR2_9FUNG|nr:hypothetical protein K493DRAFT_369749 [Basidiobolus meristosporus CBS 931.73]ORX95445.1 hypothetical protein K493DRAFT_372207 [Basidiobolus meristosporus CBS 931.73]|eukprot:ORX63302.1 hypothetical protein K493DRAFT_369749 [Basidiobolus meristosporus CBS 931.73]